MNYPEVTGVVIKTERIHMAPGTAGALSVEAYAYNNRPALFLDFESLEYGTESEALTVNLPDHAAPKHGTFIPDGNGLGGVAEALAALGLVKILETGVRYGNFDATATLVEITFPGMESTP